jgi:chitodextrinase
MLTLALTANSMASIKRIWAVDDTEKVKRNDVNNPLASSPDNPAWNGREISLFGARNEMIAFQLIIEADAAGVKAVNVSLDALTGPGSVIKNTGTADPYDYLGKRIEFFTVHYWNVTRGTTLGRRWYAEAAPPAYYQDGWLPVAMIPFEAPAGLGGAPFDIESGMNQAVWVDLLIPRDATPGQYLGSLVVTAGDSVVAEIPVKLDVYDFVLPDVTHFKNFFWFNKATMANKHGVSSGSTACNLIDGRYHQMAHRHRLDLSANGHLSWVDSFYRRYLDGSYYTAANRYEGPGQGVGNGTYSIGTYDQGPNSGLASSSTSNWLPDDQAGWQQNADNWVQWFARNAPQVEFFKYMIDEPAYQQSTYPQVWQLIKDRATWVRSDTGPGQTLRLFCTVDTGYPELDGFVDFWSSNHSGYNLTRASQQQAKGAKTGLYNGWRPQYGAGVSALDVEAADARIIPWVAFRYQVDQYFFWYANNYTRFNPFLFISPSQTADVLGNGEVILPGQQKDFPADDRQLQGPIATFVMKAWRRGQQDYEYLWLASQKGLGDATATIAAAVVPRALSEVGSHTAPAWPLHGKGFEDRRRQLAELLSGSTPAQDPVASITASPREGLAPLSVVLDASASHDPDGQIRNYAWTFGDGSSGSDPVLSHVYQSAGAYTVQLTVTDDSGRQGSAFVAIQVASNPGDQADPVASFIMTPRRGKAPLAVALDASGSSDPAGTIQSFAWDFGDGTSGSGRKTSHEYSAAGKFTIRLKITDDRGLSSTAAKLLQVVRGNSKDPRNGSTTSVLSRPADKTSR